MRTYLKITLLVLAIVPGFALANNSLTPTLKEQSNCLADASDLTSELAGRNQLIGLSFFNVPPQGACWTQTRSTRGKRCNSSTSVEAFFRNKCTSKLDFKLCFVSNSGDDDCTIQSGIDPGETFAGYTCDGTGSFYLYERESGSNEKFPQ